MTSLDSLGALGFVAVFTGTLSGCAALSEYRACGYAGSPDDAKITAQVDTLLSKQRNLLLADDQVYVQTIDGIVYLTGHVTTDMQRDKAELLAREAPGASRVVDTLTVTADAGR
jgi:osmotically-inducible protein OsmY